MTSTPLPTGSSGDWRESSVDWVAADWTGGWVAESCAGRRTSRSRPAPSAGVHALRRGSSGSFGSSGCRAATLAPGLEPESLDLAVALAGCVVTWFFLALAALLLALDWQLEATCAALVSFALGAVVLARWPVRPAQGPTA